MKKQVKISLIIPVYNVEKFLARCLESCLTQDVDKDSYEIIVVNDGSTDNSFKVIEEFSKSANNMTIINQYNQGLSMARNNGYDKSTGEYVWFIDSDDWIEKNCLSAIYNFIDGYSPDLLQVGYRYTYDEERNNKDSNRGFFDGCISGKEALKRYLIPSPAQFTIFSSVFLKKNNLKFYPNIYHEDAEFKPRALFFAEKYISLNTIYYNYYQRSSGNIMSSFNIKRGKDLLIIANNLFVFQKDVKMDNMMKREFDFLITLLLNNVIKGISMLQDDESVVLYKELEKNRHLLCCMLTSKAIRHRIEGLFFKISFASSVKLFSLR